MDLPYEIWRNIWVYLPYNKIKEFDLFSELNNDDFMWYLKVLKEFRIKDSTYNLLSGTMSPKEGYLKIAGLHGIPVIGSSKYYPFYKLIDAIAEQDTINANVMLEYAEIDVEDVVNLLPKVAADERELLIGELMRRFPNINIDWNQLEIQVAAKNGDIHLVKSLVHNKTDYEIALSYAALSGNIELVRWLLFKLPGADFNIISNALMTAANKGNTEMMHLLMKNESVDANSILSEAIFRGNAKLIEYILLHYEDIDNEILFKSLGVCGNLQLINKHLDTNYRVAYTDMLISATTNGNLEVLKYLTVPGNFVDLLFSSYAMQEHIVRYLLELGARMDSEKLAILAQEAPIQFFIDCYEMVDSPDNAELLSSAIQTGNRAVVEFIYSKYPHLSPDDRENIADHHHLMDFFSGQM